MKLGETIASFFGAPDELRGCRELVYRQAPMLKRARGAVDVHLLAASLGIEVVSVARQRYEGKFSCDSSGKASIHLAQEQNDRRRRFTLAHEIGHWMLRSFFESNDAVPCEHFRSSNRSKARNSEEERLANVIAAEILLPYPALAILLLNEKINWKLVRSLARLFNVSNPMMLRRLAELSEKIVVCITAIPNRFSDFHSVAIVDSAFCVTPTEGFLNEPMHFLGRRSYERLVSSNPVLLGVRSARGRITAHFDLENFREPIPHAKLLGLATDFRST